MQSAIWVLWPSFILGGIAEVIFFTLFDPVDMHLFGEPLGLSRTAIYTIGFFAFSCSQRGRAHSRAFCSDRPPTSTTSVRCRRRSGRSAARSATRLRVAATDE